MQIISLATIAAFAASVSGAALQPRGGTCSIRLSFSRGQNPFSGGDNSYACTAELTYADGRKQTLNQECRYVTRSHCFSSDLPYQICSTIESSDLKDGYVNYAAEHADFHSDYCKTDHFAGISGDGRTQTCSFAC